MRYIDKLSALQVYSYISHCQTTAFGNSEKGIIWHSQSTGNQYSFSYQTVTPSTGKEKDSETGYYNFGARYYDPVLSGLFLSVDPMADKYPSLSPYAYCAWNPIKLVDPDGEEIWIYYENSNSEKSRVKWTDNGLFNEDGSMYTGNNEFVFQTSSAINAIYSDEDSRFLVSAFIGESEYDISISETSGTTLYSEYSSGTEKYGFSLKHEQPIVFNPTMGLAQFKTDSETEEYMAPFLCLLHEVGHLYNATTDYKSYNERRKNKTGDAYGDGEEKFVIQNYEQPAAAKLGMLQRTSHKEGVLGLRRIKTSGPLSSSPKK